MDSNRKTAVAAGVLFIIATVTDVVGTQLSQPILGSPDYLTRISAQSNLVAIGALLELAAAGACAGIAISLFPVLKEWNVSLALGSVVFRTMEAIMYMVGIVSLLSLQALSRQFTESGAADPSLLRISGELLLNVREQVIVPAVLCFSLGALMYYLLFYQSQLIPRWLSGWGIVAIILTMVACFLAWFSHGPLTTYLVALLPIALQEMVLALWLIARGFSSSRAFNSTGLQPTTSSRISTAVTV